MITKIPGPFIYMSYRQIEFLRGQLLTSLPQFKTILFDIMNSTGGPDMIASYNKLMSSYNFSSSDGLPKEYLFISLNETISDERRSFITNGIRSYFRDDLTLLLDRKDIHDSVVSNLALFQIFVGIVGFISLTLSFFLLLISTTANIKENLWEFGVLRAIGLT